MSRRALWSLVLAVALVLLAIRAFTGPGMGRSYVSDQQMGFVQSADGVWEAAPDGVTPTISWTAELSVPPRVFYAANAKDPKQTTVHLSLSRTLGLWAAAFFTLAILSFLYADNPCYKVAEAAVVGVSAAYWGIVGVWDVLVPKLGGALLPLYTKAHFLPSLTDVTGNWWMLVPLALGLMLLCRLVPKVASVSLLPLAFVIGTTAGLKFISFTEGDLLAQSAATMKPLYVERLGVDGALDLAMTVGASLKQTLLFVGVICALAYFYFSVEHKGVVGRAARVGIWYLMITFGAGFGFTVMGRIALLAARFEFMLDDWLWLIDPSGKRVVALTAGAGEVLGQFAQIHSVSVW